MDTDPRALPWRPLCALCLSAPGPETGAITVAAGYAVCRRHRNAIMTKDQGDLIERVLLETRPGPPEPGPLTAERLDRERPGMVVTEVEATQLCMNDLCPHLVAEHDARGCRRCACGRTMRGALRP